MLLKHFRTQGLLAALGWACLLTGRTAAARAQTVTGGGLIATILDERGLAMRGVTVTVERDKNPLRIVASDRNGVINVPVLAPGRYSVLAEQIGYQPVRMTNVVIVAAGVTRISFRLTRRPPPITTVDEVASNAAVSTGVSGRVSSGTELALFDRWRDVTGAAAQFSEIDGLRDGRAGFAGSGNGLEPRFSALVVDGIEETLMRHPGMPGEPASAPVFARDAIQQVGISGYAADGESPNTMGQMLTAETRSGAGRRIFSPWLTASSAKLGTAKIDNPDDSSATSLGAGFVLGGPIKGDTAGWLIRLDYQQLKQPTAAPFAETLVEGVAADRATAIQNAASAHGNHDVSPWTSSTVRSWKGGSAMGRLDWHFGGTTGLGIRAGFASWTEDNPLVGMQLGNAAGSKLEATDVSGSAVLTTAGKAWLSETRVGIRTASRDWTGPALASTLLVQEGVVLGSEDNLPGKFEESAFVIGEAFTYRLRTHALKAGVSAMRRTDTYDWVPGSAGRFTFGDAGSLGTGNGAFYQATRTGTASDIGVSDLSLFLQDTWQATSELQLLAGIRYDREKLPSTGIALNTPWGITSGFRNDIIPKDDQKSGIGPHGGFVWNANNAGRTVVRSHVGLVPGRYDLAAFAEAVQFDGDVRVRRATGALTWPSTGTDNTAAVVGPSLTFFGPEVKKPRSFKADLSLQQRLGDAMSLGLSGAYRHGDYLLRREDVNRGVASATLDDGRTVWGGLQQFGALITPAVGSNRRFPEFDMAYGLTSTGYVDYYEFTATLDRRVAGGLDARLSYTYSKTTDNLPGSLSSDPADHLSPFPTGLNSQAWEDGRSDLDMPHRIAAELIYTGAGKHPISVAARYRARSGLPFTPGYRSGVDVNGDGSGNNDPAFINTSLSGMAALVSAHSCLAAQEEAIASRNSCRDKMATALDLHASIGLTVLGGRNVSFVVDGFNLVSSASGVFDHAALLVDGAHGITTNGAGHLVLPLVANPNFGQLLSRRNDARLIRFGLKVEE